MTTLIYIGLIIASLLLLAIISPDILVLMVLGGMLVFGGFYLFLKAIGAWSESKNG